MKRKFESIDYISKEHNYKPQEEVVIKKIKCNTCKNMVILEDKNTCPLCKRRM